MLQINSIWMQRAALLLALVSCVVGMPPDNCASAPSLEAMDVVDASTIGQPTTSGMCNLDLLGEMGAQVYRVQMMVGKGVRLSTCNSVIDYHSALIVFGYSCDVPVCIDVAYTSQRDCGHAGGTYLIIPYNPLFTEVFVIVTGVGEEGSFRLTVEPEEPDETWIDCGMATSIMGPGSFMGKVYADNDEDDGVPACGVDSAVSVEWFTYTPYAPNTKVTITTCSPDTELDTIVGVMDAPEDLTTPCVAECLELSDDYCFDTEQSEPVTSSTVIYNAVGNTPNRFFVTGKEGSYGPFRVTIKETTVVGPPPCRGSTCGSTCAAALTAGVGEFPGNVNHPNNHANSLICGRINPDDHVAWYELLPPVRATVVASTCDRGTNFDTILAVVSDCDTYGCIAMNDDSPCDVSEGASKITFTVQPFVLYHIAVAGFGHSQGEFVLIIDGDLEEY